MFFLQKLNKEISHGLKSETNGEKTNGEKINGEKTNGEKSNGEKTNGEKGEHSPPPGKKEKDSSLADIEEAIPDVTMDQRNIDKLLDKTRSVYKLYVIFIPICVAVNFTWKRFASVKNSCDTTCRSSYSTELSPPSSDWVYAACSKENTCSHLRFTEVKACWTG